MCCHHHKNPQAYYRAHQKRDYRIHWRTPVSDVPT
jgi:hypothetical protein